MSQFLISEVARQVGLQPSAIRYYEQIGLLPRAEELAGRDGTTAQYFIAWLSSRSTTAGVHAEEIRQLFFGFVTLLALRTMAHTIPKEARGDG
jgi:DNA-binding transcriptional MerR regulator